MVSNHLPDLPIMFRTMDAYDSYSLEAWGDETRMEQLAHFRGGETQSQTAPLEVEVLWAGDGDPLQAGRMAAGRWNLQVPPPAPAVSSTTVQSQGQMWRPLVPSPAQSRPQQIWRPMAQSPGQSSMWRPFQINSRPAQTLLRPWLPEQEGIVREQTGIPKASVITINPVITVPTTVETWPLSQASLLSPTTTVPTTVETWHAVPRVYLTPLTPLTLLTPLTWPLPQTESLSPVSTAPFGLATVPHSSLCPSHPGLH